MVVTAYSPIFFIYMYTIFNMIISESKAGGESFVVVESEDTKFTSKAEEVERI